MTERVQEKIQISTHTPLTRRGNAKRSYYDIRKDVRQISVSAVLSQSINFFLAALDNTCCTCYYGTVRRKAMTAREIDKILRNDGWNVVKQVGSHRQYKHPTKPGKVTVPIHNGDLNPKTANSILKQAGLL